MRVRVHNERLYYIANGSNYGKCPDTGVWGDKLSIYDHIRKHLNVSFKGNNLPADLKGTFEVNGIEFLVLSAAEKTTLTRVHMTCPYCKRMFSAGRAGQHKCKA